MIPQTPRKTWFTKLAGAAAILLGGIGSLFSAFAVLMLSLLLAIAAVCFWFAAKGVKDGQTRLPVKHATNRIVSREEKPALFWTSISVVSALGTGCMVFGGWLVIGQLRQR